MMENNASNWMSIWRLIFQTLFYVAPRFFNPTIMGRKSVSLENLERPEKPLSRVISRSLGNSRNSLYSTEDSSQHSTFSNQDYSSDSLEHSPTYSSFENGIDESLSLNSEPSFPRHRSCSMSERCYKRNSRHTSTPRKDSRNSVQQGNNEIRRRSISFTSLRSKRSDALQNDNVDLDVHMSTPYSEQWNREHYRHFSVNPGFAGHELKAAGNKIGQFMRERAAQQSMIADLNNGKPMTKLTIPDTPTYDEDDDVTPEVKFVGILVNNDMFRKKKPFDGRSVDL